MKITVELGPEFFAAVEERGWPSMTITFGDGAVGSDDAVVSTHAIGFAIPGPEEGDDDDDLPACRAR